MQKTLSSKIIQIGTVSILTLIALYPLLHAGLPPTHDGEYHVIRFYEFDKVLRQGNFYPRWAPDLNNGYGVPLFNYVYPLPNYIASLLHFFGTSFIDAFKLNMFIASFVGAIFMFLWARIFWGNWGGVVSSIFYTYSPYHLLDIYIRGSVGEVWALGLFPAFLWSITKLIKERRVFFVPISAIIISLIIFSHNILALMFLPFAITYMLFVIFYTFPPKNKLFTIHYSLFTIFIGLGLSSIFWLPALFEKQYVVGLEIFDFRAHFVEFYQLIFPSWGSGFSADSTTQGLSFQIGIANLIALITSIISLIIIRKRKNEKSLISISIFFISWTFLAIFLMLEASRLFWENIPLMQYFQFPWRLLSLVILFSSFLAGGIVYFWKFKLLLPTFILIAVFLGLGYTKPAYYHLRDDNYYTSRSNFIDGTNSPGNVFNTIWFNTSLPKATSPIEKAFFPGWQAFVDGKKIETGIDKNGLIQFSIPTSEHKIEVKFLNTPVRNLATAASSASFIIILFLFAYAFRVKIIK